MDELVRSGKTVENAFELAVVRAGHAVALAQEFSKVRPDRRRRPKYRRAVIGTGVFLVNFAAIVSFFIMVLAATAAAFGLVHHS